MRLPQPLGGSKDNAKVKEFYDSFQQLKDKVDKMLK
jgi:hypothetical protein